jgi:TatD DNase family protein
MTNDQPFDHVTFEPMISGWIDTHCHVHDPKFTEGVDAAVASARATGVSQMISVGCDRATSLAAIAAASSHRDVFASVGLHPHEASEGIETIADLVATPGIVAIGEAGLDYYYEHSPRDIQRQVFAEQIAIANEVGLPLIIHTRDAWEETFEILDAEGIPERTIFHCFTGGPDEMRAAVDRGAFISFSGIVTFPSATDLHEAARQCPSERLLIETDSPYLAPVPHRGRRNEPAWVIHVGQRLAELTGREPAALCEITSNNARRAFPALVT